MGTIARMKSMAGSSIQVPLVTCATITKIPDNASAVRLTGTTTIDTLDAGTPRPGRRLTMMRHTTDTTRPVINNYQGSTTNGQIDFGSAQSAITLDDAVTLIQGRSGHWRMCDNTTT